MGGTVLGALLSVHGELLADLHLQAEPLVLVALILAFGVAAQVLADTYRVPSVLFLILAGVVLGPKGTGLVTFDALQAALTPIVGVSVAIIVFEGAFHLKIAKLRQSSVAAFGLVTFGAALSFFGTTVAVQLLLGPGWAIAGIVGALLVATGPTVITPILAVVPVRDRVAGALETEGIVNDVTAAILAVVIFEYLASSGVQPGAYLSEFVSRLSVGIVTGLLIAGAIYLLLEHVDPPTGWTPQNARLITFAGAILAFSLADIVSHEAGVAAVAAAGIVLGNVGIPFEREIAEFKSDIMLIVLSFVFVTLAALIEFDVLFSLGIAGLAVVGVVALVLRPIGVFVSTIGGRFTTRERVFMSLVGPRGIIPASVATLFAVQLRVGDAADAVPNNEAAANVLAGTVFLVILLTVVVEGGLARKIAERLDVIPMRVLIVGGGRIGTALADRLEERGENVVVLEEDEEKVEALRASGYTVRLGDATDVDFLREVGVERAKIVVAATGDDDVNLLVAQLCRSKHDVDRVIARVNEPGNVDAFEELDVETVSSTMATAHELDNRIERPALSNWMNEIGRSGDVQEIEVTDEALAGRTIGDVNRELPSACLVALVSRDGENTIPDDDFEIEYGDHLTVLGRTDSVREALDRLHPHD